MVCFADLHGCECTTVEYMELGEGGHPASGLAGWASASRALGWILWVLAALVVGAAILQATVAPSVPATEIAPLLLPVAVARLVLAGISQPSRRVAVFTMTAGMALWSVGAVIVFAATSPSVVQLPLSPAEWPFLAAFVAFATFVFMDIRRGTSPSGAELLDAIILTAGAATLAAALLGTAGSTMSGLYSARVVALLYPIIDALLAIVVVAQVGARLRRFDAGTAMLVGGFGAMAVADGMFAVSLAEGRYVTDPVPTTLWTLGLVLLAQGASRPLGEAPAPGFSWGRLMAIVAASVIAIAALAVPSIDDANWYIVIPAVVTLLGSGARLLFSLRSEQRANERYRSALIDELTGLSTQRGLTEFVGKDPHARIAAIAVDVSGLEEVNESFGHAGGDSVLRAVGERLVGEASRESLVGHLGGNTFAVLLPASDGPGSMLAARRFTAALAEPFIVSNLPVNLSPTAGFALRTPDESGNELLRRAQVAMDEARRRHTEVMPYDPDDDFQSLHHLQLAAELRDSLATGQIAVFYQPQIHATTGELVGCEALIRWNHPTRGLLEPAEFLPTARRSGLMPAITDAVMRAAVADARRWYEHGDRWSVSVNVDPPELISGTMIATLERLLDDAAVPASLLVLEITEESFVADPDRALHLLQRIRDRGVRVSLDDFGSGFSSLSHLRDLPADELKIDRSLTALVNRSERVRTMVESTITMAHALSMRVVAEGVETPDVAQTVEDLGAELLQGYLVSRPIDRDAFEEWARTRRTGLLGYESSGGDTPTRETGAAR